MTPAEHERLIGMLRRVIRDCRSLYGKSANLMIRRYPTMIQGDAASTGDASGFAELMDDLHRGLLVKVYVTIVRADDRWTGPEKRVAAAMIEHLWGQSLAGAELREAATGLFAQADQLTLPQLVAPFVRYRPLEDAKVHVETIVMRLANLVAKCDGQTMPEESVALHILQHEIDAALRPADDELTLARLDDDLPESIGNQAIAKDSKPSAAKTTPNENDPGGDDSPDRAERLATAMSELDQLIGLGGVKDRIRSYTNFLRLQEQRRASGLPTMPISLHMTFTGNPGTGKTTVARIVGQILGALGTLSSGHVVETDRSGLVGEYAGQTAPKTNKLCDTARGGVLFIDEAYSLIDAKGDDAYGREAVQVLLKRMEDDRDQMAVILAGYSDEMATMIRSNPGLSSRINTTIDFEDFSPVQMGAIFQRLCRQNQYTLPPAARHRLLIGLDQLHRRRDRHFGNGRLVRNAFEDSVRRLADRIAEVAVLDENLLTKLTAADIAVPGLSDADIDRLLSEPHDLTVVCENCQSRVRLQANLLGKRFRCTRCQNVQRCNWAEVTRPL